MFDQSSDEPPDPGDTAVPDEPVAEQYREPATEELEPDFEDVDVPAGLARRFWGLVATINVGLLAAAVGVMVVGFQGDVRRGGAAFVLGVLTLGYAYYKYQRFTPIDRQS